MGSPSRSRSPPLPEDDLELVADFVGEARDHLAAAERDLLTLESAPDGDAASGLVAGAFRAFHSIKGVAGFLNLGQVGSLAHATETLLDGVRDGGVTVGPAVADVALASVDLMKVLIDDVDNARRCGVPLATNASVPEQVAACQRAVAGETPAASERTPAQPEPTIKPVATPTPTPASMSKSAAPAAGRRDEAQVKVAAARLDALIDTVGELVIQQGIVGRESGGDTGPLQQAVAGATKLVRELQDLSMSLRMVPVGGAFKRLGRVVRDAAKVAGKRATLEVVGQDTELDRGMADALGDPLVHMVRNAIDHGLETPEERQKLGKPPAGRVTVSAEHRGGAVEVRVADDGRGLDAAAIRLKAVRSGLLPEAEAAMLTDADAFRLIFHPGLSTAASVGALSGRGVGMDVVKQEIDRLRGRVEIASTPGAGSVFTIRLPLTLAVIDGLIVRCGGQRYVLPIPHVERSIKPKPEQICTLHGGGTSGAATEILHVRGALLPFMRLADWFGLTPEREDDGDALAVIVSDAGRRLGVMVDDVVGQEQVVVKGLDEAGRRGKVPGAGGAAVLADGTVALILDVPALIGDDAGAAAA